MKRDFTNDDFEEFLKQSADQLRMKAPEGVWQNLSKELNKRRRRFIFSLSAFLLISSAVGYYTITQVKEPAVISSTISRERGNTFQRTAGELPVPTTPLPTKAEKTATSIKSFQNEAIEPIRKIRPAQKSDASPVKQIALTEKNEVSENNLVNEPDFTPTVVDSYTEFDSNAPIDKKYETITTSENEILPLTIESVINSYKLRSKKGKLETQFYFVPTISYRKLTENKSYLRMLGQSNTPANYPAFHSSVNNSVTHKPDIGFEIGVAVKYPVSNKLKLRTGLQFNVNRYDVKAFSSTYSVATIALNNRSGPDSLNTISNYSNINGYKSNWLQNLSFQVSAPVGVELNLGSNDKVQFGIAGTIQPTYVLGDRAYLITTDYKSYAQVPWLIRRWNVNTALETFVIYNSGKTKWQFGPQVRYQLLSSFISQYPVKENLFDFGFKIGISANRK
jgi:hypothetical protein